MSKNRTNVAVVVAIALMLFTAVLVATRQNEGRSMGAPADYQLLAEVDLSSGPFAERVIGELVVGETAVIHLRLSLPNLDTPRFTLRLQGENGDAYTVLHAENYHTNQDGGGDWQETLPPGTYQLRLTAAQSAGEVAVYVRQSAVTSAQVAIPLDAAAVAAFFDAALPQQLADYNIPGAAVAVVKDGAILFAQGYGYADLAAQQAASADQTLFRTGSAAKLFTWTAVMQLAEQGKLDLHTDVNTYLTGFQIPATYPEPITLAHLLTHTAGFEDCAKGAMRARPEEMEPLGDYLARQIPARVYPPGQVTAYSNYGTALAGYIVEQVSGQPYAQYVQEQIFDPLGMAHTTVTQPVPATLAAHLATGYAQVNGTPQPQPFEVFQIVPAGSASATASDMARFMIAHLSDGGSGSVLQEQTAKLMQQIHFRNAPELSGVGYGFYEIPVNGRRPLAHAGDTSFFHSQLLLLPEENLGLYLVYNAGNSIVARREMIQAFFDQFYPTMGQPPTAGGPTAVGPPAAQFAGRYVSTRSPQTTLEKIRLLFDPIYQPLTVRLGPDGSLESEQAGQTRRWLPQTEQLYRQSNGQDQIAFRADAQGNWMLFLDSIPLRGYRQLPWYESLMFNLLWPVLAVVALLGVMVWAFCDKRALPAARWLAIAAGSIVLLFALGLAAFALVGFTAYIYGQVSPLWWAVFALPLILIPVSAALLIVTLRPSAMSYGRRWPYALSVLAAVGLLIWTHYWNLLGWHF
jgi:CubicO group peptidase (beta-lactamase class C family)